MDFFEEKEITCFLPYEGTGKIVKTVNELKNCKKTGNIFIVYPDNVESRHTPYLLPDGCQGLLAGFLHQTRTWKTIVSYIDTPYTLLYIQTLPLHLGAYAVERMLQVITDTDAGMIYADRYKISEGLLQPHPVIDYQEGSLRDDFDFGSLFLFQSSVLKEAVSEMDVDYQAAALYDLRLKVSKRKSLFHLPEFLYTESETDVRKSGEKMFDYVDPKNRQLST